MFIITRGALIVRGAIPPNGRRVEVSDAAGAAAIAGGLADPDTAATPPPPPAASEPAPPAPIAPEETHAVTADGDGVPHPEEPDVYKSTTKRVPGQVRSKKKGHR